METESTSVQTDPLLRQTVLWRAMVYLIVVGLDLAVVKILVFGLTGPAAILSDAAESTVHVVAILFAACSLRLTYKPADRTPLYVMLKSASSPLG